MRATSPPPAIASALRDDLLDGNLAPGTRLTEESLSARFGTRRAPRVGGAVRDQPRTARPDSGAGLDPGEHRGVRRLPGSGSRRFVEILGQPEAEFDDVLSTADSILLTAAGQVLDEVAEAFPGHHAFQPVVDGDVLLDTPIRSLAAGHGSAVPLLIGSNEDEGSLFVRPPMPPLIPTSDAAVRRFVEQDRPQVSDRVLDAYTDPSRDRFGTGVAAGGDGMVTVPAMEMAEAQSRRAPVYA